MKIAVLLPDNLAPQLGVCFVNKLNSCVPGTEFQVPNPETEDEGYSGCMVIVPKGQAPRQAAYLGLLRGRGVPITAINCWGTQDAFLWLRWADNGITDDVVAGIEHACRIKLSPAAKKLFSPAPTKKIVWGAAAPSASFSTIQRLIGKEGWIPVTIWQEELLPFYQTYKPELARSVFQEAAKAATNLCLSVLEQKEREYSLLGAEKLLICGASETEIHFVQSRRGIVFTE